MHSPSLRLFASSLIAIALSGAGVAAAQSENVGLNGHDAEPAVLDMAADLGVGWIRVDANWFQMEPRPGEYRWILDDAVRGASERGLEVYITLAYTADWVPRVPRARSDGYGGNDEPVGSAEWRAFVTNAVRHYRALGVTHFGIWNEPNLEHFFEGSVDAYIDKILVPGADAVREACSDCTVLGPDLAHVGNYHDYLTPILRRASDRIDIVAHHIYQGFPELGTSLFDGDNFVQALEMRRFSFTRPSLREILDAEGWTGEVWITETGYRAARVGDPADEADQATYVRLVLEEQLTRTWWTNTFFYEALDCGIDIAGCDIDGFGLTRPDHSRPRDFPGDFRTKPAYDTLRGFIDSHPEIGGEATPPPPPDVVSIQVPRREALSVDGSLEDFGGVPSLSLDSWDGDRPYGGSDDLSAEVRFAFREGALFVAIEVTDDTHVGADDDALLWASDSVQLAIDVLGDGGSGYGADDHELTVALARGEARVRREHGEGALPEVAVLRSGSRTIYEVALSPAVLPSVRFEAGAEVHASLIVNDADDGGREGWLELTPGIGREKIPGSFAILRLAEDVTPPPPDVDDGGVAGPDAAVDEDAGVSVDGGTGAPPPSETTAGGCNAGGTDTTGAPASIAFVLAFVASHRRRRRRVL